MSTTPGVILVGGGVRSGKSAFALRLAKTRGTRRAFVATAEAHDDEMRARIRRHRSERGEEFRTIEAPDDLPGALRALHDVDVVVVDCFTLWLSNRLLRDEDEAGLARDVQALVETLHAFSTPCIVVTNEVGMGVVPPSRLGRAFRDAAGLAHQRLATIADEIYLAALGTVLRLRPGPVETVRRPPGERR